MPVFTSSSEHLIPKSQLRHRPIAPSAKPEQPPCILRASRTQTHQPLSTMDAPVDVPAWLSLPKPSSSSWWQHNPLVKIVLGMLLTATLILLGQLATNWIMRAVNDLRYGYPRTSERKTRVKYTSCTKKRLQSPLPFPVVPPAQDVAGTSEIIVKHRSAGLALLLQDGLLLLRRSCRVTPPRMKRYNRSGCSDTEIARNLCL